MKKVIFLILLLLAAIVFWKGYDFKKSILPHVESDTVVIEYTDDKDLLTKLREVKTGRKVELRDKGQGPRYVDTGISCNDEAAKAAYMEKFKKETEELNDAINTELKRIQQIP